MSANIRSRPNCGKFVGEQDLQVTHGAFFGVVTTGVAIEAGAALGVMHTKWLSSWSSECKGVSARTYSTLPRRPASLSPQ